MSSALLIEGRVHVLEHLAHIAGEPMDGGVPVTPSIELQGREDAREHRRPMLCDEVHNVLIVPQEEGPLCHLYPVGDGP